MGKLKAWKGLSLLFILALVLSLGMVAVPMAGTVGANGAPSEVWVDDAACPGPGTGTQADPYCKIQDGIDNVAEGGTVHVAAGTYNENPITVNRSVTLLGAQANVEFVDGGRAGGESVINGQIDIWADDVTVNGFEITGVKWGIACRINRALHQNVSILYNYIHLADGAAVGVNLMTDNPPPGVDTVTFRNYVISRNYVNLSSGTRAGIGLNESAPDTSKNYVYDRFVASYNEITIPHGMAMWTTPTPSTNYRLDNPVMTGNHVHNCDRGFYMTNMYNAGINSNVFENCNYCGCQLIILGGTVTDNRFQDMHPSPASSSFGLMLLGTATGHPTGSHDVVTSGNAFYYNNAADKPECGALVHTGCDVSTIQFIYNNFYDGGANANALALKNYNAGTDLNAENNWWGANDGPDDAAGVINGSGGKISADVDADPWMQFVLGANPTQIVADGTSQSALTAKLKNSDDSIVAPDARLNQLPEFAKVTFTTDKGEVGSSSVTKNLSDGQATATLTSSTTVETATVTAQAKDTSETEISGAMDNTTVDFIAGASSTVTLTVAPLNITANGTSTSLLTATVKDEQGHPVADGTDVVFETDHGAFASSTVTKQTNNGVATATLTSEAGTEIIIATIIATANGASDAASVFFIPEGGAEVEQSKTELTCGSGTINMEGTVTGISDIYVDATSCYVVTAAKYDGNPGGTPTFQATGDYYDVHLNDDAGVHSLTIEFCPADEDTVIYYWDGTSWRRGSNQRYDAASGCIVVTVTNATHPNLSDLSGRIFASGTPLLPPPSPPVGGEAYPINKIHVLAPWIALFAAIILGATLVWRRCRAQG